MEFPFQILPSAAFDVVGFGTNAVDHLISVAEYPAFDSKVELTGYAREAGGEVATTLVGLQRLGMTTAYIGRFGSDDDGKLGLQSLIDEGVDTAYAETVVGSSTQKAFSIVDDRTGERTIIWYRDKNLAYGPCEVPLDPAARGRVLHLTPLDTLASIQIAKAARASGVVVSIDIDSVFESIDTLLPLVDILTSSSSFPHKLTGLDDGRSALSEIASRFGCSVIGMTRGRNGSLFLCNGVFVQTPGFAVPDRCKDTTGAGDAFRTGFLYGLLTGESVETCTVIANAVGALNCRQIGARSALPTLKELNSFLKNI